MAWNNTEPYLPAAKADVRIGIVKMGKMGNARASITLSKSALKQLGDPDTCDVFAGDGEEAGQVMIQCDGEGAHEIRELNKGGGQGRAQYPAGHAFRKAQADGCAFPNQHRGSRRETADRLAALVA